MDDFDTAKQFFLEGMRLLEANDLQSAEDKFARSLEIIPNRISTLNNLSAIKIKLNQFVEAEEFALKAIALDDRSPEAWANLGVSLTAMKRHEEALQACDRALNGNASHARGWLAKAMVLRELKRFDEALMACDEALKFDSSQYEIVYAKSLILKELDRPVEAQKIYRRSLQMRVDSSPVFIAERHASQKADALIIHANPGLDDSLKSFESLTLAAQTIPPSSPRILVKISISLIFSSAMQSGIGSKANSAAGFCDKQLLKRRTSSCRWQPVALERAG